MARVLFNGVPLNQTLDEVSDGLTSIYRGFSSRIENQLDDIVNEEIVIGDPNSLSFSFSIQDIALVREDLLNHIYTDHGERVHMPGFGTRIPTLVFEQVDQETVDIIEEDLTMVFDYDPRVELMDLQILPLPDNNAIVAIATLNFVELDIVEELKLEFLSL